MLKHGGRYENYFSWQTVTHLICSQLPDSKINNLRSPIYPCKASKMVEISKFVNFMNIPIIDFFRSFSRGLPVVKPAWIMDSLAANMLLNFTIFNSIRQFSLKIMQILVFSLLTKA